MHTFELDTLIIPYFSNKGYSLNFDENAPYPYTVLSNFEIKAIGGKVTDGLYDEKGRYRFHKTPIFIDASDSTLYIKVISLMEYFQADGIIDFQNKTNVTNGEKKISGAFIRKFH